MIATSGGLPGKKRGTAFHSEALKRNLPSRLKGCGLSSVKMDVMYEDKLLDGKVV